jgi:hypothetical protein
MIRGRKDRGQPTGRVAAGRLHDLVVRRRCLVLSLVLALMGALVIVPAARAVPAAGAAQPVVVDFETGPPLNTTPVTDEYLTTSFVRFIQEDPGFRPYRRSVGPARAHSGSDVVDVGADVCTMEVADFQSCEFTGAGTQGRLSRTARAVTVFAGLFRPTSAKQVTARLVALRADGSEAASSAAVPVNATNFTVPVTVTSTAGDIAAFALHAEGPGATGGSTLGFDDLTLTFPDSSLADVSLTIGGGELVLLQGGSLDVPVTLLRLNGSDGPLPLSFSALPSDVTATLLPNPVPGTEENAVLRLTATDTAAPSLTTFTITADPQGNNSVAPAIRTATSKLRVSANYELEAGGAGSPLLPQCAPVEFPLRLPRSPAFRAVITLTAENVPPGVTADFVPGNTLGPEGALLYLPRLRLHRETGSIPPGATVLIRASSPGVPDRTLPVPVASQGPTAMVNGTLIGYAPMRERLGTQLTLSGNGFCQGTKVEVGNPAAVVATTVSADGRSLQFRIPRLATAGPITVVPPGVAAVKYAAGNLVDVRTFRNYYGFQFRNFKWGSLSFAELSDVVGDDDLFTRVNPCWPVYDCSILTPIPNAEALVSWAVLKIAVRVSKGHCFGIVRTQQELLAGRVRYDRFTQGADHPFALGSSSGPGGDLRSYLDGRHAAQFTEEISKAFFSREKNVATQVQRIRAELQAGRYPGVSLFSGGQNKLKGGHVVTAYDVEETTDGFNIYVYDGNTPFVAGDEIGNSTNRTEHELREIGDKGVIHVNGGRWDFFRGSKGTWTGTGGTIWAIPLSAIPKDPTLITGASLATLTYSMGQFGSADGAARVTSVPAGAEWLPALDDQAPPGAAGTLIAPRARPLSHTVEGTKDGTYSELLVGKGFTGAVTDVPTGKGVTDRVTATPAARTLRFSGSRARPLQLTVAASLPSGATHTAIVRTTTAAGGRERTQLTPGGALVYQHHGKATRFSVELLSTDPNAGVARAVTGPLRIAAGDRVTATPEDWRSLSKIRLKVRRANGVQLVRMLNLRPVAAKVGVRIGRLSVRRTAHSREVVLKTMLSRVPAGTVGGVVLELKRAGRVVASRSVAVRRIRAGTRTDRWQLPRHLSAGGYRLVAHVTVVTGGARPASLRVTRSADLPRQGDTGLQWPVLRRGDEGEPVQSVQYLLRAHGHRLTVDGIFGRHTKAAVRAFQRARGLTVDGVVGQQSWQGLIITVRRGSTGEAVRAVQDQARFHNLSGDTVRGLAIDGIFGPRTEKFVHHFQQALHQDDPDVAVDGIVGPITWNYLVRKAPSS